MALPLQDHSSVANIHQVHITHIHLNLEADFNTHTVHGYALLDFTILSETDQILLDIFRMDISRIALVDADQQVLSEVAFNCTSFSNFGDRLTLNVSQPFPKGKIGRIKIDYTAGSGPGFCWLSAPQTAGKKHPYLFTQGQAVLNRSFFPCQDTPSVRMTYSAEIFVPKGLTAVMSAEMQSPTGGEQTDNENIVKYKFLLNRSIPSYLVAMAVGDLMKADIGPRSAVWTEPCMLEAAQNEFASTTEQYIAAGESLFGPYVWDRYDLLIMPPAFPFGGMENPRLTFVTPCLICGDKSLTDVVAHEIAHSWFGNLVTNASWSDFWVNEGFTMYAQRRITDIVHGKEFTALEAIIGWQLLLIELDNLGHENPLTRLRVPIAEGVDPEETYNEIPYEKGYACVMYLRSLVGNNDEVFDGWIRQYVADHNSKSIFAESVFEHFLNYFPEVARELAEKKGSDHLFNLLHLPGLPTFLPDFSSADHLTEQARVVFDKWTNKSDPKLIEASYSDIETWLRYQQIYFLDMCSSNGQFSTDVVKKLSLVYGFYENTNPEIQMRWLDLVIKYNVTDFYPKIYEFLESQGKQKYTLRIYRSLVHGNDETREIGKQAFASTKHWLHANVVHFITKIFEEANYGHLVAA